MLSETCMCMHTQTVGFKNKHFINTETLTNVYTNLLYAPLAQTQHKDGKQLEHTHTHTQRLLTCMCVHSSFKLVLIDNNNKRVAPSRIT